MFPCGGSRGFRRQASRTAFPRRLLPGRRSRDFIGKGSGSRRFALRDGRRHGIEGFGLSGYGHLLAAGGTFSPSACLPVRCEDPGTAQWTGKPDHGPIPRKARRLASSAAVAEGFSKRAELASSLRDMPRLLRAYTIHEGASNHCRGRALTMSGANSAGDHGPATSGMLSGALTRPASPRLSGCRARVLKN